MTKSIALKEAALVVKIGQPANILHLVSYTKNYCASVLQCLTSDRMRKAVRHSIAVMTEPAFWFSRRCCRHRAGVQMMVADSLCRIQHFCPSIWQPRQKQAPLPRVSI